MRTKKEGTNTFSNFQSIRIYIDYTKRGKTCNTLQLTWGGHAEFDLETMRHDIGNYNISIRRFFNSKVRDGYFTNRFIYINDIQDNLEKTGHGLWFPKMFLFLEEEYEKTFVVDYLKTLFTPLADYHQQHKTIRFSQYNSRNEYQDNKSIPRPA